MQTNLLFGHHIRIARMPFSNSSVQIDMKLLHRLRQETSLSIQRCKEALISCNNDFIEAKDMVLKRSVTDAEKNVHSVAELKEGAIGILQRPDGNIGLVHLACMTDFVARSEQLKDLAARIVSIGSVDCEDAVKAIKEKIGLLQEKIACHGLVLVKRSILGKYLHNKFLNGLGSVGAVVALEGENNAKVQAFADQLACHVAGLNPDTIETLLSQKYIFSDDDTTVKEMLESLSVSITEFNRMSTK